MVDQKKLTTREVISNINKIFDPLGLLAPITIKFKSLLQKLIKASLDWDKPLQGELAKEAGAVLQEMGDLPEERILPGCKPFTAI